MHMSKKYIEPGKRLMDLAYIRDGSLVHTGEALVLALLIATRGKTQRGADEVKHLAAMLDDPNIDKKRKPRRKK
jgi:predicted RecA/RadA family phage recombinase